MRLQRNLYRIQNAMGEQTYSIQHFQFFPLELVDNFVGSKLTHATNLDLLQRKILNT